MKTNIYQENTRLRFRENFYSKMIEEIEDYAILLLDLEGKVLSWNKGSEKIKGYTADEIIGANFSVFYTKHDQENGLPKKILEKAYREGKAIYEGLRVRKDGSCFWGSIVITAMHDDENNIIGFSKITRDLTEKRVAEEHLRLIIESVPNALLLVNEKGQIVLINKQTENLFGYSRSELVGKHICLLLPAQYQRELIGFKNIFFKGPSATSAGETRDLVALRKDKSEFQVEIGLNKLDMIQGHMVLASVVDITERKVTESKLKKHVKQLEFQNRELEQFGYIASHDLQEPLRTVSNFVDLLCKDYQGRLDETADRYLQYISDASGRMRELIKALLYYSRIGRERKLKEVDCNKIMEEVISDLNAAIQEAGAEIVYRKLPVLHAYPAEIKSLFQNLISNSIKFRKKDAQVKIKIEAHLEKNYWKFSFQDNAIGIQERFYKKIFVIFQRLHATKAYEGTGIGLAHSKKIVELHGGEIWLNSEFGHGSTFYFTIPTHH